VARRREETSALKPIVEVQNLSKLYRLGSIGATSLRDTFERIAAKLRSKADESERKGGAGLAGGREGADPRTFWAIKDVSFSTTPGQVVAIVGKNGAGKSTLLKILSRITEPTSGRAILRGRLASLLEVGTGFHPDLTGRENIFLNGAILGMKRWEIARKLDEIIEFAEVGAFIETPVKRYSSGMFVRLAFAVAAHLEPEILFIDEVLAVGDAAFQRKCLGKMGEVATKQGRTVFFVSHNMGAIRALCEHAILIEHGRATFEGAPTEVIRRYLAGAASEGDHQGEADWDECDDAPGNDDIALRRLRLLNAAGDATNTFEADQPVSIEITYEVRRRLRGARIQLQIGTPEGEIAFQSTDHHYQAELLEAGRYQSVCTLAGGLFNRRRYTVSVQCDIPGERYVLPMAEYLTFDVSGVGNQLSSFPEPWPGVVCPRADWRVQQIDGLISA
jgi:lipopolysaccharide transport system ATP-binding protein